MKRFLPLVLHMLVPVALAAPPVYERALTSLTASAEKQARPDAPLRAIGSAGLDGVEGLLEDRIAIFLRTAPDDHHSVQTYVELREAGTRVLLHGTDEAWIRADGSTRKVGAAAAVPGTTLTIEDLYPFTQERCSMPRVADASDKSLTFTCEPPKKGETQYSMVVYKMDRSKSVADRVMYYKETLSNLVKVRLNESFGQVGGAWRPTRVVFQDFKLQTRDVYELDWSKAEDLPAGIFDPATLEKTSPVDWSADD